MATLNVVEQSSKASWILIPSVGTSGQYISTWKLVRRIFRLSGISLMVFKIHAMLTISFRNLLDRILTFKMTSHKAK